MQSATVCNFWHITTRCRTQAPLNHSTLMTHGKLSLVCSSQSSICFCISCVLKKEEEQANEWKTMCKTPNESTTDLTVISPCFRVFESHAGCVLIGLFFGNSVYICVCLSVCFTPGWVSSEKWKWNQTRLSVSLSVSVSLTLLITPPRSSSDRKWVHTGLVNPKWVEFKSHTVHHSLCCAVCVLKCVF